MPPREAITSIEEWLSLPELSIPSLATDKETGSICTVIKVGFLGVSEADCRKMRIRAKPVVGNKCVLPTSVVEQNGARQLVRLSLDLAPWVIDCVTLANTGRKPFPSKVEFGELNGRLYAEFVL
jgi:hypothetical protein